MEVTAQLMRAVWEKAQIVEGFNPDMYRKDPCGAWIVWDKYGVQDSLYGWQIDHIYPAPKLVEQGFQPEQIDDIRNLRPMQHHNNLSKADDYPSYMCAVTSEGKMNKYYEGPLTVNEATRKMLAELYQL